jgi:hypothetical protein
VNAEQLLQIESQVKAEVVGRSEALSYATGRIAEGVGDEGQGRSDTAVLELGAQSKPFSEQVLAGQDQLERRGGREGSASHPGRSQGSG